MVKLSKMKEAEELEEYARKQVNEALEKMEKKISNMNFALSAQIKKIVETHLEKKDFIGKGENCQFKTLMDFSIEKDEKALIEFKKINQAIKKSQYEQKVFKDEVKDDIKVKVPTQLKTIQESLEDQKERFDNIFKDKDAKFLELQEAIQKRYEDHKKSLKALDKQQKSTTEAINKK